MVVNYHEILLNFSTSSDGTQLGEADKNIARTIMAFLGASEKTSPEIEQHAKKKNPDVIESKTRSILFKLEDNEILRWSMRVVPLPDRPMNKVCFCSLVKYDCGSFGRIIEGKIEAKIDRILASFIEGESQYFCKSKGTCTNGLIFTSQRMCDCNNICPSCGEALFEMDDDDKKTFIAQLVDSIPPFINKEHVIHKMYMTIFPHVEIIPSVSKMAARHVSMEPAFLLPPALVPKKMIDAYAMTTFDDALMLLGNVITRRVAVPFSVIVPGSGTSVKPAILPPVHASKQNGMKYFTVPDVIAMSPKDVMIECFKRWIVATGFSIEAIMQGKQSDEHKKRYSMTKLFFLSTMGKKHLSRAMVGKESREMVPVLDAAIAIAVDEGLVRIESSHPKLLPGGVKFFTDLCKSGKVYHYVDHESSIKTAESNFWKANERALKPPSKKMTKIFTIRVQANACNPAWLSSIPDIPVLPPEVQLPSPDFFSVTIKSIISI